MPLFHRLWHDRSFFCLSAAASNTVRTISGGQVPKYQLGRLRMKENTLSSTFSRSFPFDLSVLARPNSRYFTKQASADPQLSSFEHDVNNVWCLHADNVVSSAHVLHRASSSTCVHPPGVRTHYQIS